MRQYKYYYAGDSSFENAYHDCKLVAESIVDEKSFQNADTGLILYYMDRILEALEKQVTKEVKEERWIDTKCDCGYCFSKSYPDGYHDIPYERKTNYCPKCGKKLGWRR